MRQIDRGVNASGVFAYPKVLPKMAEIRFRAERRIGELMAAQRDAGLLKVGNPNGFEENPLAEKPITLAEAGIDHCPCPTLQPLSLTDSKEQAHASSEEMHMGRKFPDETIEALILLNREGWTDYKIAKAVGFTQACICKRRNALGIEANNPAPAELDAGRVMLLVSEGLSDSEIARRLGYDQSSVTKWRNRQGLPPNYDHSVPRASKIAIAKKLQRGASRRQVADELDVPFSRVARVRKKLAGPYLRRGGGSIRSMQERVRSDPSILDRIRRAVGLKLPEHIREEAVYDLYGDVFEGKVAMDLIEEVAPSYRSRAYEMCGSTYGKVRLDQKDERGLSPMDWLAAEPNEEEF